MTSPRVGWFMDTACLGNLTHIAYLTLFVTFASSVDTGMEHSLTNMPSSQFSFEFVPWSSSSPPLCPLVADKNQKLGLADWYATQC